MLDTVCPIVSVYIYISMWLYAFLLLAKGSWFTSNISKLSCTSWYDDDNGNDDDTGDEKVMMMVVMMIMALTELKY